MYSDTTGKAPEWWQWVISSAMFVAGVALVATGVGGAAGGALICAGVNSVINSYVTEATGGSATAGWVGGMITGALCGVGAGIGGEFLLAATKVGGVACLGQLALGFGISFVAGTGGSLAGQYVTAAIDKRTLSEKEAWNSAIMTGSINMLAAIGAGMGNAMTDLPGFTTTSTVMANSLNTICSVSTEAICDVLSIIISLFG